MKRFASLFVFIFSAIFSFAQVNTDLVTVDISSIKEDSNIVAYTHVFIDSESVYTVSDILNKPFSPLTGLKGYKRIPEGMVRFSYYLKFRVSNRSETTRSVYVYPGSHFSAIELYKINPLPKKNNHPVKISGYRYLALEAGEEFDVVIYLKLLKNDFNGIKPTLINAEFISTYKLKTIADLTDLHLFGYVLSGVLLMMILFMLTSYVINRRIEFLYNALHSLCLFLLIFCNALLARATTPFGNLYYSYLDFFLLITGTVFYISFIRKFLDTATKYLLLDRVLKYSEWFIVLLLCLFTFFNFFTPTYEPQFYLENIIKFFSLALGIAFIYLALKIKDRLFTYIAAGNAFLVFFSAISLTLILTGVKPTSIFISALFYYYLGIALEISLFVLGLTYKNRRELIRSIQEQEALKMEAEKIEFESQLALIKVQQDERNRISADMHDDLGAGMTTIRLYSEIAKSKLDSNAVPEIDKISSSANELLNKMNAIIWSMNSSNDSLGNMIAYIRSYALEYFEDSGIKCRIVIPENLPNIEVIGEIRRNVFLVIKEALNNILKHSRATEVQIKLERVEDGLTLYIQDNGVGIDMEKLRQFGNGLKNMKKRMQDINIEFNIENKNGTLITLHRRILNVDFF